MSRIPSYSPRVPTNGVGNPWHSQRVRNNGIMTSDCLWYTAAFSFVDILNTNPGPQMSYQIAFCLWLLSFEQIIAEQINKCVKTVAALSSLLDVLQEI